MVDILQKCLSLPCLISKNAQKYIIPINAMKVLKDLFILFLITMGCLIVSVAVSTPVMFFGGLSKSISLNIVQWISCIGMFFVPAIIWCRYIKKENPLTAFKFTRPSAKAIAIAVVFALVSVPFGSSTVEWIEMLPFPQAVRDYVDGQLVTQIKSIYSLMGGEDCSNPLYIFNAVLLIGIVTGIVEETMFRGAVRKVFSDHLGVHTTAILVGLVFSLIHFEFYGFIWRWFLGGFYVYLVYYSGSIWTSIIAHAINNSVAVVVSLMADEPGSEDMPLPLTDAEWLALAKSQDMEMPGWIVAISAVLTVLVLVYFWKNRHNFKNNSVEMVME